MTPFTRKEYIDKISKIFENVIDECELRIKIATNIYDSIIADVVNKYDDLFLQKSIENLSFEEKGFWGRGVSRLLHRNEALENEIKKLKGGNIISKETLY